MSAAKRDQSAFRQAAASATLKLKSLTADSLELAPAWGTVRAQGSDPYNAIGHRSVNRAKTGSAARASGR